MKARHDPPFGMVGVGRRKPGLVVPVLDGMDGRRTGEVCMKARHIEAYRTDARAILSALKIGTTQDFHTLTNAQVDGLFIEADIRRYQRPHNANGSRAHHFCTMLQRRAS